MDDDALFQPRGNDTFVPTHAAVGPWDAGIVHGAAVAALLAGRLTPADRTLARLTVEILAPVPVAPVVLELSELAGGARVQRQDAVLSHDGRTVATARAVVVRRTEVDLPARALAHDTPFDPDAVPPLAEPNRGAADMVGWECFDSRSLIIDWLRVEGDRRIHQWIGLACPVVEGTEIQGTELAAVAADYAQSAVHRQLPLDAWSFRNAELTLHLSRDPLGPWMGVRCESVLQSVGTGFNAADLYDRGGRVGRSAATVVVEQRGAGAALTEPLEEPRATPEATKVRSDP